MNWKTGEGRGQQQETGTDSTEFRVSDSCLEGFGTRARYTSGLVEKVSTCLCGEGQVLMRNDTTDTCSICFNIFPKK